MRPQLGDLIRAWREKRDLTVRGAAPLFDVSPSTLSRIERGAQIDGLTVVKLITLLFAKDDADGARQPVETEDREEVPALASPR